MSHLNLPLNQFLCLDASGAVIPNARIRTYVTGTTTNATTYADGAMATPNANPVVAGADGLATIYLSSAISYRFDIYMSDNTTFVRTVDPVDSSAFSVFTAVPTAVTTNTSLAATNMTSFYRVDTTSGNISITLPAIADVAVGAYVVIKKITTDSNTVLVTRSGSDTIEGSTTYTIYNINQVAMVISDGSQWRIWGTTSLQDVMRWTQVASSVNYFRMTNAATGNGPILSVEGTNSNIDMNLQAKGTGTYNLKSTADQATWVNLYEDTDNGSNKITVKAPAAIASDKVVQLGDGNVTLPDRDLTNKNFVWELIETQTISGQANATFSSISNSTYKSYLMVCTEVAVATDAQRITVQFSQSGSFVAANYRWTARAEDTGGLTGGTGSASDAAMGIGADTGAASFGNNTNESGDIEIKFNNLGSSTFFKKITWDAAIHCADTVFRHIHGSGEYTGNTNAVDGIRISSTSGNISGTFTLYGRRIA